MPTICPNCLRPVRSEALFCGYCGSNLNPTALDEAPIVTTAIQPGEVYADIALPKPKPKPNGEKIRRTVLIGVVILLCLVLIAAFLIHYLPDIRSYLGALITLLLSR